MRTPGVLLGPNHVSLKLLIPHKHQGEENVYNQNTMLFLKMEWRQGVEAGTQREMWEQIQCLCMNIYM